MSEWLEYRKKYNRLDLNIDWTKPDVSYRPVPLYSHLHWGYYRIDDYVKAIRNYGLNTVSTSRIYQSFNYETQIGKIKFNARVKLNRETNDVTFRFFSGTFITLDDLFKTVTTYEEFIDICPRGLFLRFPNSEIKGRYIDYDELFDLVPDSITSCLNKRYPLSIERFTISELLNEIATWFIAYHEEGHLVRGHLHYLREKMGITDSDFHFDEMSDIGKDFYRKVFEHQADHSAACGIVDVFLTSPSIFNFYSELPIRNCLTLENVLRLILVAITSVFLLIEKKAQSKKTGNTTVYPSPRSRLYNTIGACLLRISKSKHQYIKDMVVYPSILSAINDIDIVAKELGLRFDKTETLVDIHLLFYSSKKENLSPTAMEWVTLNKIENDIVLDELLKYRYLAIPSAKDFLDKTGGRA